VSVITPLRLFDEHGRRSWLAELPTLNPSFSGRRACYCYLWCPQCASDLSWESMALIKKDLCNESAPVVTWMRQGHFPGEATFVPRPATTPPTRRLAWPLASAIDPALAAPEDDGVLLASVHQGALETYLLVINATTMATIAEIRQPHSRTRRTCGERVRGTRRRRGAALSPIGACTRLVSMASTRREGRRALEWKEADRSSMAQPHVQGSLRPSFVLFSL